MKNETYKISRNELLIRLSWSLDMKLKHFASKFAEFMIEYEGECYCSFSGGKDSQVACDIIDKLYAGEFEYLLPPHTYRKLLNLPKPPRVFCNTGNEFPEIVKHVKSFDNVVILKPLMGFTRVFTEIGVALGSKKIAEQISRLRKYQANPSEKTAATMKLYLTGVKRDGSISKKSKIPNWSRKLIDAPFKISEKCCDVFKKEPFRRYMAETGRKPIYFTTVDEGDRRKVSYMQTGCNSFENGKETSRPFSIFTEDNVWEYHDKYNLRFAEVYYERTVPVEQLDGTFKIEKLAPETRTGCVACGFGLHLEDKKKNNRFQRLAISHPKFHSIVINKIGWGVILDYMRIPYMPKVVCGKQFTMFDEPKAA